MTTPLITEDGDLDYARIRELSTQHDDMSAEDLAARLVRRLTKAQLGAFASAYVVAWIDHCRRDAARAVERAAERVEQAPAAQPKDRTRWGKSFQDWYDDPPVKGFYGNADDRRKFRRWCGDKFDDWYDRALAVRQAAGDADEVDTFLADFHPDGIRAHYAEKRAERVHQLIRARRQRGRQRRSGVTASGRYPDARTRRLREPERVVRVVLARSGVTRPSRSDASASEPSESCP